MKILKIQTDLQSYLLPIVKIIVAVILIVIMIFRHKVLPIENDSIQIILSIICSILAILCILSIYIAIAEIFYVYENRSKSKGVSTDDISIGKQKTLEDILFLLEQNDIIEIEIRNNEDIMTVGASSDCKPSDSVFFDKKYYIEDTEYERIEDISKRLEIYAKNRRLLVISIDGIKQS